jgi:hypothetical protein
MPQGFPPLIVDDDAVTSTMMAARGNYADERGQVDDETSRKIKERWERRQSEVVKPRIKAAAIERLVGTEGVDGKNNTAKIEGTNSDPTYSSTEPQEESSSDSDGEEEMDTNDICATFVDCGEYFILRSCIPDLSLVFLN